MTSRTLGTLALKIWGVTILIAAVTAIPASLAMLKTMPGGDPQAAMIRTTGILSVVNLVFHAVVGAAIVVWSDRIVSFIVDDEILEIENITMADLVPLTFGVVGIFVLIDGLRNVAGIAYALYVALYAKSQFVESTASYVWERQDEAIVRAVPQIVAGIFLIAGRDSIARWWLGLRGTGPQSDVDAWDDDVDSHGDEQSK